MDGPTESGVWMAPLGAVIAAANIATFIALFFPLRRDRRSGEPVLFELQQSIMPEWNGDQGLFQVSGRWLLAGVVLAFVPAIKLTFLEPTHRNQLVLVISLVMAAGVALESWHRRDFVTLTCLVHQRGILGGKQVRVPLADIESIDFTLYNERSKRARNGDVTVRAPGVLLEFHSIPSAPDMAQRILDRKQRALERAEAVSRRTDREAHLPPPS